ncbi:polyprenol monophosphomannose synthase, partial [bacterium]|nr:polyprenol monophosphomannose synthase [bacterium]
MDADFAHRPEYIPQLLVAIGDAVILIGSRGVAGGDQVGRGIGRKIITRLANCYIMSVLGIYGHDLTSGYRLFRTSSLSELGLEVMISKGPEIVQEILCLAQRHGLKRKEFPIVFHDRSHGQSTFNWKIALRSMVMMWRFRFRYRLQSALKS